MRTYRLTTPLAESMLRLQPVCLGMKKPIYVRCDVSGEQVAIEASVQGHQLHPHILTAIRTDFPVFRLDSFISLNRLLPYVNRVVEHTHTTSRPTYRQLPDPDANLTFGQRLADRIADFGGSWTFILLFLGIIIVWMTTNVWYLSNRGFDPYPFILLNLVLSCLAALQAPVIMMSQNRQEERDRERARQDYEVNLKAESEIRLLQQKMDLLLQQKR
ncbi:DUF1003 domain-containing protein [Fibrella sp. WM1]|uniref:DUF1003 domain-containing protein n=1 Tax=Fibrella musci TaxID=3242485 RepID=UPI003521E70A